MRMRAVAVVLAALSGLPLVAYAGLLALASYARVKLGHWPYYAHPDPKDADLGWAFALESLLFDGAALVVLGMPFVLVVRYGVARWRNEAWPARAALWSLGAIACGAALWILDFQYGQFASWLID